MRKEAHLRENEFVKGEWTDALVFAMLADSGRVSKTPLANPSASTNPLVLGLTHQGRPHRHRRGRLSIMRHGKRQGRGMPLAHHAL